MKFSQTFEDAEFLANFANLDSNKLESFRQSYADFFPEDFWPDGRKKYQDLPAAFTTVGGAGFDSQQFHTLLRQAWNEKFPPHLSLRLVESLGMSQSLELAMGKIYPYQQAVMFLQVQPWRTMICKCGRRFVADHIQRKYCSVKGEDGLTCAERAIRETHRESWAKHGSEWRRKKSKSSNTKRKAGGKDVTKRKAL